MAEDPEKKEEDKFEFTPEGEAPDYLTLDQAQVRAMQIATEAPGDYVPLTPASAWPSMWCNRRTGKTTTS